LTAGALEPANASGLRPFAAHRFLNSGGDIGAGVLDSASERGSLTSSRYRFTVESAAEEHTDFHAITGPTKSREGDQSGDCRYEQNNDESDLQSGLIEEIAHLAKFLIPLVEDLFFGC
jgi:hypothetical protein